MTAINVMVKKCAGLVDTRDVTAWESEFLRSLYQQTNGGNNTSSLTEKQVEVLERIYGKHFA